MSMDEKSVETVSAGDAKKNRRFDIIAIVLCLLFSLSIWLYVENINQDIVEKEIIVTFDAEKQIFNETGMYIFSGNADIDYSQVEVKLTVSGSKALLEKYDDSEYAVELDTSGITQAGGRYGVYFKYKLPNEGIQYKSIVATAYTSSLMLVDHKTEREVPLGADYVDVPSKKESIITCTPKTDKIFISGPASMVNEINNVVALVNVNALNESTVVKSKNFEFFGDDGSPILLNGSYISLTPTEVEVDVTIKYVNEPISVQIHPTEQEIDAYIYKISVGYENGSPLELRFDGDSAAFPDNGLIIWPFDNIEEYPEEKRITVADFMEYDIFDLYRNNLALHVPEDADRVIIVKVSKTPKMTDNTNTENSVTDSVVDESEETPDTN